MEKLDKLIKIGQTNKFDSAGYTALHYAARGGSGTTAARNGHLTACERLLNAGADVNACTRSGATPLIRAAMMGNFKDI